VMVPSGGYTEESHKLVADTIVWACAREHAKAVSKPVVSGLEGAPQR
jgi:hypothetical protein